MKRRHFVDTLCFLPSALSVASISADSCFARNSETEELSSASSDKRRKPNIIFIMADDLGYGDLGCYGQKHIKTPHIDDLAKHGLLFIQAYAGAPVCTPSRCSLMTGFHNGHTAARDNIPHYQTYLDENDVTIAEVLKQAGYRCGGVGKWSLGDAGSVGRATNQGFDMWLGYLNQDHAHYYYPEYLDDNEERLELMGNTTSHQHYSHDLMTDRALDFIEKNKETPFFLYAAYTLPHFSSTDEDSDGLSIPSTVPYEHMDWDEKSKKFAAMVHRLDRDVGRIQKKVNELGLDDNTIIIFTSDNGGHGNIHERFNSNGPLNGSKRDLTEGGIRVPFIAYGPGRIPSGKTSNEIIAFWDMMPTFAELAGVEVPSNIDGISFLNALNGFKLDHVHDYLYWDYGHCRDRFDQAVRMGKWKGIRLGEGNPLQLYDLENDIGEKTNVAANHPDIIQTIEGIMEKAVVPNDKYPVGKQYEGGPIWKKSVN